MLKERNGKADRLYKKITKSFEKALDIKYRIRAVVRFYAFFILHRKARKALSFAQLLIRMFMLFDRTGQLDV